MPLTSGKPNTKHYYTGISLVIFPNGRYATYFVGDHSFLLRRLVSLDDDLAMQPFRALQQAETEDRYVNYIAKLFWTYLRCPHVWPAQTEDERSITEEARATFRGDVADLNVIHRLGAV